MLVLRVESMLPRHCVKPGLLPRSLSRTKSGGGWGGGGATELLCLLLLVKRHGVLLLAPLVYLSITLIYMGRISPDPDMPPGSVYRSPQLFRHLWPNMHKANTSFGIVSAWQHCKEDELWRPCIDNSKSLQGLPRSTGFLIVEANGGLNQQRSSICNAVAVASLLNATLVIPRFHLNSVWKDPSPFADIYDQEHFIKSLAEDVRIVRQVPDYVMESVGYNMSNIFNFRVKAWSPASFYLETVLPKLRETGVIRISPFANRLSFDNIPPMIQRLRCFTNFEALRFSEQILATGKLLVDRMVKHSALSDGKYISVHLRFEEDMVAFSCCIYDGGNEEKLEMDAARERGWRGKFNRTGRIIDPGANRVDGKCPLTPLEVGMMLRGMGFHSSTPIYIAAGKIYKADKTMAPLLQMFPHLQTKETLLSPKELAPFEKYSSRMAALDYMVCLHSEVFVTTQGGNFPHFLIGHRRFLYNGHSKTINPDKRKLALLLDSPDIGWDSLSRQLESMREHSDAKGHDLRKPTASIYTYPAPDCMCLHHYDNMDPLNPS